MAKLKVEVDDKGIGIEFAGSTDNLLSMTMQIVNGLYTEVLNSGHEEAARLFKGIFHDPVMVDALFATSDEERDEILNRANRRILEALFDVFGKDPGDDESE